LRRVKDIVVQIEIRTYRVNIPNKTFNRVTLIKIKKERVI
jgi:hypothetical protein